MEALHGVADFDEPGRAAVLAAKLLVRLADPATADFASALETGLPDRPSGPNILVHECDQGHFPAWLASRAKRGGAESPRFTIACRNVLAIAASARNLRAVSPAGTEERLPRTVPVVDLGIAAERLREAGGPYDLIVSFPEAVPRVDRAAATWAAVGYLLAPNGLFLIAQPSTEAERFDRAKARGFSRVGDLKRDGFRAVAYRKT